MAATKIAPLTTSTFDHAAYAGMSGDAAKQLLLDRGYFHRDRRFLSLSLTPAQMERWLKIGYGLTAEETAVRLLDKYEGGGK